MTRLILDVLPARTAVPMIYMERAVTMSDILSAP
jgi:hypothetical protein